MLHSIAGAAPLINFTRAKRLSKCLLVTGNKGYAKTEFKREGAKAGRPFQFVAFMSLNRIGPSVT